ncbi:pyridoxal phosphate-dependent aminotransferase [Halorubellus sp. JP-L1]|uniref:pyridoxal phosphate-dependent aminotransferase n=1 Tax=Halorubellus sp. JP-L1 TaxID=2715753 RepID=UPI00140DB384|nr:pyridoxal phosphate-dependent aminotransferase [Halorubellus sp. JP-L1]NHN41748.1 pyridoxal phosphate-dependent aminotransferase [Halorubellus sp. JP-L1]
MTTDRLQDVPGFDIDEVANAAGDDPEVLRLENLDVNLMSELLPEEVKEATRDAVGTFDANSYLPFIGKEDLREAVAGQTNDRSGQDYGKENVVITCSTGESVLDSLLAMIDPGDEVVLTDPIYAGMINRTRLAGGEPSFVPYENAGDEWRLDVDALEETVTDDTEVLLLVNPSMPSGAVLNREEWETISDLCQKHDVWLLYNAIWESVLFDDLPLIHPASLDGMAERTVIAGSVTKSYGMIGWRVGWIVGPEEFMNDAARTHIYNTTTPGGIGQAGALAAIESDFEPNEYVPELQRRRDTVTEQLRDVGVTTVPSKGGWMQLMNVEELGYDSSTASDRLLEESKVAATPMRHWGDENSDQYVRIVFSNEPVERLEELGERIENALL